LRHQELREEVAGVARRMISSGLVTGTSGNVSARTPEGDVLITPSGLDYSVMEPEDVVLVNVGGEVLEGEFVPSTETPMHTGIYRARDDVGGIVHTHSKYATTLACLGWEIPPVHYMLAVLSDEGRVPLAPYTTYGTEELARYASDALGAENRACLLQNHGTITIGQSPSKAFSLTEILEDMAEVYYRTRLAGEPILLTEDQMSEVHAKIHAYGQSKSVAPDSSS
jgi:L-fuculose-phosphate aldolase